MPRVLISGAFCNREPYSNDWKDLSDNETVIRIMQQRKANGTFKRIRKEWSLNNFKDGYVDNRRRFRVWSPSHPRAYKEGYILRSIVAFEAYHGIVIPLDMDVHHIDKNRLNDSKENLALIPHKEHAVISNVNRGLGDIVRICEYCNKTFKIKCNRLNDKTSKRGRFCSQKCYRLFPRSEETRQKMQHSATQSWKNLEVREKRQKALQKSWDERRDQK